MDDRPFDAPNLLRHAAGRLHGFPDISEDLLDAAAEIERLRAAIDGIRWVLDGEHGTMRHTTFARLDADECREIAELLAVYSPPQENDR